MNLCDVYIEKIIEVRTYDNYVIALAKKGGNNKLITIMRKGNEAVQITTAKSADIHRAIEYITLVIVADKHGRFMLQADERYSESKDTDAIRNHKNIIKRYKLQGFKVTKD